MPNDYQGALRTAASGRMGIIMNKENNLILRAEYISRVNIVQDYIENNISDDFSLDKLAGIANFSSFHFHRVFYSITGETLFQYIQRIRLEKSAKFLMQNQKKAIMEIALECGFSNQSSFAKAFKNYFGKSAARFRTDSREESNLGKVSFEKLNYNNIIRNNPCYKMPQENGISHQIEVKNISDMNVVYIRHTGPYKTDTGLFESLSEKLDKWAMAKGLCYTADTKWLTIVHDSPEITEDNKLRISYGMTVSDEDKTVMDGEFGRMKITGGKYAIGHFELADDEYQKAWNIMYSLWLPESGYQPDDRLSLELYQSYYSKIPGKLKVDIYIPVKPLHG